MELALKEDTLGPLSFALVVPTWRDDAAFKLIESSPYVKANINIPYDQHSYCHGAQYRFQYPGLYSAPFDTSVFFLQNELGSATWPVTEAAILDIRSAFAINLPRDEFSKNGIRRKMYIPKHKRTEVQNKEP
jgi:hypothetical protein